MPWNLYGIYNKVYSLVYVNKESIFEYCAYKVGKPSNISR